VVVTNSESKEEKTCSLTFCTDSLRTDRLRTHSPVDNPNAYPFISSPLNIVTFITCLEFCHRALLVSLESCNDLWTFLTISMVRAGPVEAVFVAIQCDDGGGM